MNNSNNIYISSLNWLYKKLSTHSAPGFYKKKNCFYLIERLNCCYRNNQSPGQSVRSERREKGTAGAAGTGRRARHHYRKSVRAG